MTASGCALVEDGTRNLCLAVSTPIEIHREKARNQHWAEAAWQSVCMKEGPTTHSDDFARGFKDGFAEHLFRGGISEPPLVAPLRYRHFRYQNAKGYQAIQDWFAGFRHGACAARDSGARRWITGPSSLLAELPAPAPLPWSPIPPQLQHEEAKLAPPPLPRFQAQLGNETRAGMSDQQPVGPAKIEFLSPLPDLSPEPHEARTRDDAHMRQRRQSPPEARKQIPARPVNLDFRGDAAPIITLPTEPDEMPRHEVKPLPLLWELPQDRIEHPLATPTEVEVPSPRVNLAPVVALPIKESQESINVRFNGMPLAVPAPAESRTPAIIGVPVLAPLPVLETQVTPDPLRQRTRTR